METNDVRGLDQIKHWLNSLSYEELYEVYMYVVPEELEELEWETYV